MRELSVLLVFCAVVSCVVVVSCCAGPVLRVGCVLLWWPCILCGGRVFLCLSSFSLLSDEGLPCAWGAVALLRP